MKKLNMNNLRENATRRFWSIMKKKAVDEWTVQECLAWGSYGIHMKKALKRVRKELSNLSYEEKVALATLVRMMCINGEQHYVMLPCFGESVFKDFEFYYTETEAIMNSNQLFTLKVEAVQWDDEGCPYHGEFEVKFAL